MAIYYGYHELRQEKQNDDIKGEQNSIIDTGVNSAFSGTIQILIGQKSENYFYDVFF